MEKQALIIFVRKPQLGKVKTRLAAVIGNEAALCIYKMLLQHTCAVAQQTDAWKAVFYAGEKVKNDLWSGPDVSKYLQPETDLGSRMKTAFETVFADGACRVVIIGSDCPSLTADHLAQAFVALENNDVVIGPAADGGYYLLGMKKLQADLFQNIPWSTDRVYAETIAVLQQHNLRYHTLETLTDVDEEKDLPEEWRRALNGQKWDI
jgi:rSAM/selenodomain-associated transferase 1